MFGAFNIITMLFKKNYAAFLENSIISGNYTLAGWKVFEEL